jgi:6-phosphofructokinase 1
MAGKTGLVIGYMHDRFIHVPIELLTSRKKSMDPDSFQWKAVLASTGQTNQFD